MTIMSLLTVAFVGLLSAVAVQSQNYDGVLTKHLFSRSVVQAFGARCLDGSPAGLYYRAGTKSDKFMIYLEGGAYCTGEADCIARSKTALGSSLYWDNTIPPHMPSDILSNNATTNPYFGEFNAFYIPYCSGDLWLGGNTNPSPTSWNLTFAGTPIFWAAVETITAQYNLGGASEVVLTGVSAGGMGVFYHLDRFADYVNALTLFRAKVVGAPQAGWFSVANFWPVWLANPNQQYLPPVPDAATLYFVNTIIGVVPPPTCNLISDPIQQYNCTFYIPGYYQYLRTPSFIAENLFDTFQIYAENGVPLVSNATTNAYLEYFGATMRASLTNKIVKGWQRNNGLWASPCLEHELTFSGAGAPVVNGKTFAQAFYSWYKGQDHTSAQRFSIDSSPVPTCFGNQ